MKPLDGHAIGSALPVGAQNPRGTGKQPVALERPRLREYEPPGQGSGVVAPGRHTLPDRQTVQAVDPAAD